MSADQFNADVQAKFNLRKTFKKFGAAVVVTGALQLGTGVHPAHPYASS